MFARVLVRVFVALCLLVVPGALGDTQRAASCLSYLHALAPDTYAPMDGRYPSQASVNLLRGLVGRLNAWGRGETEDAARARDVWSELTPAILGPMRGGNARRSHGEIREAIRAVLVKHGLSDFADRTSPSANMALTLLASLSANSILTRAKRMTLQSGRGADRLPQLLETQVGHLLEVAGELSRTLGVIERYEPGTPAERPARPVRTVEGTHDETEAKETLQVADFLRVSRDGSHVSLFADGDPQRDLSATETIVGAPMILTVSFHGARGNWGVERRDGSATLLDNGRLTDVLEHAAAYRDPATRAIFLNGCNSAVAGSNGRVPVAETVMKHSGKIVLAINGVLHTVKHNGSTFTWVEREGKMVPLEEALVMFVPGKPKAEKIRRPDQLFPDTQFVGTNSPASIKELFEEARGALAQ